MRHFFAFVASLLLAISLTTAHADQSDPRLPELFEKLQAAPNTAEASSIERTIWSIWHTAPDDDIQLLLNSGMRAMQRGNYPVAMANFNMVIERAPEYAEGWNKRATLHYILRDFEASLADIDETLSREPRHIGALSGRGLVLTQEERFEEAIEAFRATLRISPRNPAAASNVDFLEKLLKRKDI